MCLLQIALLLLLVVVLQVAGVHLITFMLRCAAVVLLAVAVQCRGQGCTFCCCCCVCAAPRQSARKGPDSHQAVQHCCFAACRPIRINTGLPSGSARVLLLAH
jgi:hypothetical protein